MENRNFKLFFLDSNFATYSKQHKVTSKATCSFYHRYFTIMTIITVANGFSPTTEIKILFTFACLGKFYQICCKE